VDDFGCQHAACSELPVGRFPLIAPPAISQYSAIASECR
jgi:hypothetical protein